MTYVFDPADPRNVPGDIRVLKGASSTGLVVEAIQAVPGGPTDLATQAVATKAAKVPPDLFTLEAQVAQLQVTFDALIGSLSLTPQQLAAIQLIEQTVPTKFAGASLAGWL